MKTVRHSVSIVVLLLMSMTNSAHAEDITASCPPASSDVFYYPERTFDARRSDMDESFRHGFATDLAAMNELSLSCGPSKEREIYRLLFLPTFNHPVAVRITDTASGIVLESTELSGESGYYPGMVFEHKRIQLNERAWKELKTSIAASMFWSSTTSVEAMIGIDGDLWIIEGRKGQEYHAVGRFHPKGTSFGDLGQMFFKLAGITPQGLD
jgi:hypothetical protein